MKGTSSRVIVENSKWGRVVKDISNTLFRSDMQTLKSNYFYLDSMPPKTCIGIKIFFLYYRTRVCDEKVKK